MSKIEITHKNDVFVSIDTEEMYVLSELSDFFTYTVPGSHFMPAYRNGMWDGKIRLLNTVNGELYCGLVDYVYEFAERNGHTVEFDSVTPLHTREEIDTFIGNLNPHAQGEKIDPYEYQKDAIHYAINDSRALLLSPTSSGKSLMIYGLVRWYLEQQDRKILIIVPTTSLVEQMYKDFEDYAEVEYPKFSEDNCHRIYSGKDKKTDKRVVITTWQSIYKLQKKFFSDFGCVIGDEAHGFKSKSLTSIMTKTVDCPYKFGFTGTLDGTVTHKLVLEGLFGPVHKVITTKELMDSDTIARLHIEALIFQYSEAERKVAKKFIYKEEMDFILAHEKRNNFIVQLASRRKDNTLILFNLIKHGEKLLEEIKKANPGRPVFFVSGKVKTEEREEIRRITEESTNAIIIASYGTYSTGINIRNLHNIIFAHPSKSRIRNLQSVGRGLRKAVDKDKCTLFDLSDDLSWKKHKNFSLKHFVERIKIYNSEKFDYKLNNINL
jgi:superfamily II DNA or RNA helicase